MRLNLIILISIFLLPGCQKGWRSLQSGYRLESPDGRPHYDQLDYWAAHPDKWDPSDSMPRPLRKDERDTMVDVFFIHPTTYTDKGAEKISWSAAIEDPALAARTDYSSILYQASVFNEHGRIFAPRYRQAHIASFFTTDTANAKKALDTAYADIKSAFFWYMEHENHGRPLVLAGHSQGALLLKELLRDYHDYLSLHKILVAAYIIGWPVSPDLERYLPVCSDSLQTGCFCSWRTLREGYLPSYVPASDSIMVVTNPLTWTTGAGYANRKLNKGTVLLKFNKIYPHTTGGRITKGVLWVRKPRFPWSFLVGKKNYHVGDINLYYMNIRENVEARIFQWNREHPGD